MLWGERAVRCYSRRVPQIEVFESKVALNSRTLHNTDLHCLQRDWACAVLQLCNLLMACKAISFKVNVLISLPVAECHQLSGPSRQGCALGPFTLGVGFAFTHSTDKLVWRKDNFLRNRPRDWQLNYSFAKFRILSCVTRYHLNTRALEWASATWLAVGTQMRTSRQPEALTLPSVEVQNVCNVFHMLG